MDFYAILNWKVVIFISHTSKYVKIYLYEFIHFCFFNSFEFLFTL